MSGFDYNQLFITFRKPLLVLLIGIVLIGGGIIFFKSKDNFSGTKIEVLSESTDIENIKEVIVEISGEILSPGVYKLEKESRVEDLLRLSGGFTDKADKVWTDKYLNRAAKLNDGQKVYIPSISNHSQAESASSSTDNQTISSENSTYSSSLINVNTASLSELDSLPGIGPVYAQNIIEHRPYSAIEELVSKGAIKQSLFNKIKDLLTLY